MDHLKVYFLLKIGIFQPAMLVYQRVAVCYFGLVVLTRVPLIWKVSFLTWGKAMKMFGLFEVFDSMKSDRRGQNFEVPQSRNIFWRRLGDRHFSCNELESSNWKIYPALRILTPPMETPDPPLVWGLNQGVFDTKNDIPRILREVHVIDVWNMIQKKAPA